jgi:regulator of cell morphogenesis and NO signaling
MNATLAHCADPAGDALVGNTLGSIARRIPGATAVLRRHRLDFCCGGDATLADAARVRGADATKIAAELRALAPVPAEVSDEPLPLIDHILERYHETHRRELPELIFMARRVEEVHADHPELPKGLSLLLEHIAEAIEEHMQKEERILFPMIRTGLGSVAVGPITAMRHEHVEHGERLRQLELLTHDHVPPADACTTWQALYAGTRKLVDDVMQHIHLENNVLFPQFTQEGN